MSHKHLLRLLPLPILIVMLVVSGCTPLTQPAATGGITPTPVVSVEKVGTENPNVFVDPAAFQDALLQALAARETEKLQMWMTDPFLTGKWRGDLPATSPADALKSLYADQLGAENQLALVKNADLKALMGGKDPLSIPRGEAGVTDAFLVSGWGKDGLDEAILFVDRQADNSLKWLGWMQVQGGISGARLGGIQPYKNDALGFSLYLPKDYQVNEPAGEVAIVAPRVNGEGDPGLAIIFVEPANGRSAEAVAEHTLEEAKAQLGAGATLSINQVMTIEEAQAFVINHLPGQDSNTQLFMIHDDLLYHIMFIPDNPQLGVAYRQMEDVYAMIVNTFHFTK
jgi:hypothetical protein